MENGSASTTKGDAVHLSESALRIAWAVRAHEGADVKGVGPSIEVLLTLDGVSDMPPSDVLAALEELGAYGYFRVSTCIAAPRDGVPKELLGIAKVAINESMQELLDDLEE